MIAGRVYTTLQHQHNPLIRCPRPLRCHSQNHIRRCESCRSGRYLGHERATDSSIRLSKECQGTQLGEDHSYIHMGRMAATTHGLLLSVAMVLMSTATVLVLLIAPPAHATPSPNSSVVDRGTPYSRSKALEYGLTKENRIRKCDAGAQPNCISTSSTTNLYSQPWVVSQSEPMGDLNAVQSSMEVCVQVLVSGCGQVYLSIAVNASSVAIIVVHCASKIHTCTLYPYI